eukprot:2853900-Rhodomonas_salina.1
MIQYPTLSSRACANLRFLANVSLGICAYQSSLELCFESAALLHGCLLFTLHEGCGKQHSACGPLRSAPTQDTPARQCDTLTLFKVCRPTPSRAFPTTALELASGQILIIIRIYHLSQAAPASRLTFRLK